MKYNEIQIHYFLPEGLHSADAFLIAKAESEFIHMIKEVAYLIEIDFKLDVEALTEGGLIQTWKAFGANSGQIGCLLALISILISLKPQPDKELVELQKEQIRLQIEVLKKQLKTKTIDLSAGEIENAAGEINKHLKVIRRRSNFYQSIINERRIDSVSFTISENGSHHKKTVTIEREKFHDFVALMGELPPEKDENAVIGIISPVLKKGRYKWKGEYKGNYIEFWITDTSFKRSVLKKEIEFHSGTAINCVLDLKLKVDEIGELTNAGYIVRVVKKVLDDDYEFVTKSGRIFESKKENESNQLKLF